MTWRELSPESLYDLRTPLIIDVRSPSEHEDERIPHSLNVPLLLDDERAEVGTIYKEQGEMVARRHALKFISRKVPDIIDKMMEPKLHGQPVVVYCWRGGLRSEAVASLLSIAGISCSRLTGGYKAWRKMVLNDLQSDRYAFEPVVIHGMTGVGKTEVLAALRDLGAQSLDLEALANHRGSAFGAMGLGKQPSQKDFESHIWLCLRAFKQAEPVFLEAESRKIGKLSVPDNILRRIRTGRAVLVKGSLDSRAQRLAQQYMQDMSGGSADLAHGLQLFEQLRPFVSKKIADEIVKLASEGNLFEAIKILLTEYYDPLYLHSLKQRGTFDLEICCDEPAQIAAQIAKHFPGAPLTLVGNEKTSGSDA